MSSERRTIIIQVVLFVLTFITTTLAGCEWCFGVFIYKATETGIGFNDAFQWTDFVRGMQFSIPLLLILTAHEFGHYFTARNHGVRTSLPYYLPFPPIPMLPNIGTLGAVIRLRSRPAVSQQSFDIGLAGPLAGFIMTLIVLVYGFRTLPPPEYVFEFHPEYKEYGLHYADHVYSPEYYEAHLKDKGLIDVQIGSSLLMEAFTPLASDPARVPNPHELMHYPVLLACAVALLFMCLNLLPIGQLDGGHVVFGLAGRHKHFVVSAIFLALLLVYSGTGVVTPFLEISDQMWGGIVLIVLYYSSFKGFARSKQDAWMYAVLLFAAQYLFSWMFPTVTGYPGWLVFGFVVGRFIGVQYPPVEAESRLDRKRIVLGWIMVVVFIISFSPKPIVMEQIGGQAEPAPQEEKTAPSDPKEQQDEDSDDSDDDERPHYRTASLPTG